MSANFLCTESTCLNYDLVWSIKMHDDNKISLMHCKSGINLVATNMNVLKEVFNTYHPDVNLNKSITRDSEVKDSRFFDHQMNEDMKISDEMLHPAHPSMSTPRSIDGDNEFPNTENSINQSSVLSPESIDIGLIEENKSDHSESKEQSAESSESEGKFLPHFRLLIS